VAGILAAFAAAVAAIHPRGDFPLNDDWDFATAAWHFARTGEFAFSKFTAVSLRAQVVWGALWTRAFGESFEVLRASTLLLAAATLVVVYVILARAGAPPFARVAATLALAFNPAFLWASCTFHTEIPFVFTSAVAFYFFVRALEEERLALLIAGCAAVAVSCFVRQTGVATLLAPLTLIVWRRRPAWRRDAAVVLATMALFVAVLLLRPQWLTGSVEEFANHFKMWRESSFRTPQQLAIFYHYLTFHAQAVGLFFLPLTGAVIFAVRKRRDAAIVAAGALFFLPRVHWLVRAGHLMPYFVTPWCCDIFLGNVLNDWTLGQPTLTDVWRLGQPYPFHLTTAGRLVLTYGALVAAALVLFAFFRSAIDARVTPRLATLAAAGAFAALLGSGIYVDRYSLDAAWMVAIAGAFAVPWERRGARAVAAALLIVVALFDVFALQEYFAWNRARWAAYRELRAGGVAAPQIDGGAEPTSLYEMRFMTQHQRLKFLVSPPRDYLLAFRALPGYRVVARHPFEGWLGWHRGSIYTLRRLGGTARGSAQQPTRIAQSGISGTR
jgi:hypothetical protein